jgi:hypothetical protein
MKKWKPPARVPLRRRSPRPLGEWFAASPSLHNEALSEGTKGLLRIIHEDFYGGGGHYWFDLGNDAQEQLAGDGVLDLKRETVGWDVPDIATAVAAAQFAFDLLMTAPFSDVSLEIVRRRATAQLEDWRASGVLEQTLNAGLSDVPHRTRG